MGVQPLFVRDTKAAAMLDLPCKRFRELVAKGALPRPFRIENEERWAVIELASIQKRLAHRSDQDDDLI